MSILSIDSATHYRWGDNCDGWHLAATQGLSVIQERVPSGSFEVRHFHNKAEQFFYVLKGVATIEVDGVVHAVHPGEGIHVNAGVPHQLSNHDQDILEFIVVSTPPSHGDRVNV